MLQANDTLRPLARRSDLPTQNFLSFKTGNAAAQTGVSKGRPKDDVPQIARA
ncbi:MAG: hypothetical protein ACFNYB_01770 [Campylobacter sp.]